MKTRNAIVIAEILRHFARLLGASIPSSFTSFNCYFGFCLGEITRLLMKTHSDPSYLKHNEIVRKTCNVYINQMKSKNCMRNIQSSLWDLHWCRRIMRLKFSIEFFTNTTIWQYCHYCQFFPHIFAVFSFICTTLC